MPKDRNAHCNKDWLATQQVGSYKTVFFPLVDLETYKQESEKDYNKQTLGSYND